MPDERALGDVLARRHDGLETGQSHVESRSREHHLAGVGACDRAGQRRAHLVPGGREDVDAEVDRRGLVVGPLARGVQARLPVSSDRAWLRRGVERRGRQVDDHAGLDARERPAALRHARREAGRGAPAGEPERRLRERERHGGRRLEDRPVPLPDALGIVVVGLEQRLLLRPDRDDRRAGGDQVRQRRELGVVERAGAVEPSHDLGRRADWLVGVVAERDRGRDGELAHAQRARDVAEVDDAAGHHPPGAVASADDVPVGHVAVHDLAGKLRREQLHGRRGGRGDLAHERAPARVLDVRRERLDDRADVARIPLHGAVRGSVLEVLECARDLSGDTAERDQHRGRQMRDVDQRRALDERHEAHEVGRAVALERDDVAPVERGTGARDLERQALCEVHHGAVLQVELGLAERGVRDLEHEAPGSRLDEHVLILVRAEACDGAVGAEAITRERPRLLEAEARRVQLVSGEADAHAGYGIASCSSRPKSVAWSTPWPAGATRSSRSRASSSPSTP